MQSKAYKLDITAISLSGLCFIHCLLLPILVSSFPLLGVISEVEWMHKVLVLTALPISYLAFSKTHETKNNVKLPVILAFMGLITLLSAAFIHELHDIERALTAIGAFTLASAHILRWKLHAS